MSNKIRIAIDGPAASGKSTTARLVAEKLNFLYIDTGAMYRAITLAVLMDDLDVYDEDAVVTLARKSKIELISVDREIRTYLNDKDVSEEIRLPDVTKIISIVSAYHHVREIMVEKQQQLASHGNVVMEGRDIGTNVIPDAEIKIFMDATIRQRALRRHRELKQKGISMSLWEIENEIQKRDELDSSRETAPLKPAEDAHRLDTSVLTISEQVDLVLKLVTEYLEKNN